MESPSIAIKKGKHVPAMESPLSIALKKGKRELSKCASKSNEVRLLHTNEGPTHCHGTS